MTAKRISRWKCSAPNAMGSSGVEHLERDRLVVPEVLGELDRRHAAAAKLRLESVALGQRRLEDRPRIGCHDVPSTSFLNLGFWRSGSNVGSIRSHPGDR
jgi:hypothetical protein